MSSASTVAEYLSALADNRQADISAVRSVILKHLPKGYEEGIQYGMIGYFVPHSIYPAGYHCNPKEPLPFVQLGSQKNHMVVHMMCIYINDPLREWFESAWNASGKNLDMGKGCIRFKKVDDLALDVLGECISRVTVESYVAMFDSILESRSSKRKK